MKQVLIYSDSLTWGIVPSTRKRLDFTERWPGVMEQALIENHCLVRVIENCLNGRRTAWDDPYKPGRNGLQGIEQVIEMHSPLSLIILMLGTNDFQSMHQHNAWHSSQGMAAIINAVRRSPIEPGMSMAPILLIAPPPIQTPKGVIAPKFEGGEIKCQGLAQAYAVVAKEMDCAFFDAATVTPSSIVDGIHLDKEQHMTLGKAIADKVMELINS